MNTLQETVSLDTTEKLAEHVNTTREEIKEDHAKRVKLAIDGLEENEAIYEFDGDEITVTCSILGITVVARIEASADWEDDGWDLHVGEFREVYIDFGRGTVCASIPPRSALAQAIRRAATAWHTKQYEGEGAPEKETQDD